MLVLALAFVVSVKTIRAEDSTEVNDDDSAKSTLSQEKEDQPEIQKEEAKKVGEKQKEEAEEKNKESKGKTLEEKKVMQLEARTKVANGMMQRTENLSNIINRIKTRIEKIKLIPVDTTNAESLVVKAEESIALAKIKITAVQTAITNGDTLETIKANIVAVKDALKQAHSFMSQIVQDLKSKIKEQKEKTDSENENEVEKSDTKTSE